jgi:hypothetical protein
MHWCEDDISVWILIDGRFGLLSSNTRLIGQTLHDGKVAPWRSVRVQFPPGVPPRSDRYSLLGRSTPKYKLSGLKFLINPRMLVYICIDERVT